MARKYINGEFVPKNTQKYVGKLPITYRSSWEQQLMTLLDSHPNVIQWSSESITIPYVNPFTKRATVYVPDFLVVYVDKNGKKHGKVIEVKPLKEALDEHAKTRRDKAALQLNKAKWAAAIQWCSKHGLVFEVMTEAQLFQQRGRK